MQLLESALAFTVVMVLLSTIVTGIVEALLRLFHLREETLKETMSSLFEQVIWPRVKEELKQTHVTVDMASARKRFVDAMTLNPAALPVIEKEGQLPAPASKRVDALSIVAFAERLGRTDVGQAMLEMGAEAVEPLIKDFTRSFERFGRAASEVFRTKAKQVAIVVGIVLAFGANIDAGRLFTTLMQNPDLRTGLIEQGDEAIKQYREALDELEKFQRQIDEEELPPGDQSKEIKKKLAEMEDGLAALKGQGLPIGHVFFPYCIEKTNGDPECVDANPDDVLAIVGTQQITGDHLRWFALTVTAGVLMGLGGPFWFRVFSSLSQLFQVLRAVGIGSKTQQAKPEEVTAPSKVEDSEKPTSVLDAFMVAGNGRRQAEGKESITLPETDPQKQSSQDPSTESPNAQSQDTASGAADASVQPA